MRYNKRLIVSCISFTCIYPLIGLAESNSSLWSFQNEQQDMTLVPLEVYSPGEGVALELYAPIRIEFIAPYEAKISKIALNGRELHQLDTVHLHPGQWFFTELYNANFTDTVGKQVLEFYLEMPSGETATFVRTFSIGDSSLPMHINSPLPSQSFSQGDTIPISVLPSSGNTQPRFIVTIDGKAPVNLTQAPYEYQFKAFESGSVTIVITEMDGEEFVTESSVWVSVTPVEKRIETSLKLRNATAFLEHNEPVTISVDVTAFHQGQPSESLEMVERVDLYIEDQLVSSDDLAPFEFQWNYDGDMPVFPDYSKNQLIRTEVIVNDQAYTGSLVSEGMIEILPKAGAEYCRSQAKPWDRMSSYHVGEVVMLHGFYYQAASQNLDTRPTVGHPSWNTVQCNNTLLSNTQIEAILLPKTKGNLGERVTIEGRFASTSNEVPLERILIKDEQGFREVGSDQGVFRFEHTFQGERDCYSKKCDIIDIYPINQLGYTQNFVLSVEENTPPTITAVWKTNAESPSIYVKAYDDAPSLWVNIYKEGQIIGSSAMIGKEKSHTSYKEEAIVPVQLEKGTHQLMVEVIDDNGSKTTSKGYITH